MGGPRPAFVATVLGACALVAALGLGHRAQVQAVELVATEVVRVQGGRAVLVLREKDGGRWLPVPIAQSEGLTLDSVLRGRAQPGLGTRIADALGARVLLLSIDEAGERTMRAHLDLADGRRTVHVETSVVAGIAAALEAHAPIVIDPVLLDQSGISPDDLRTVRARAPRDQQAPVQPI